MTDTMHLPDEQIIAMCKAHDKEQAAQMGEPSPWDNVEEDPDWEMDRIAAMRCAVEAVPTLTASRAQSVTGDWVRDTAMNVMLATEVEEANRILCAALEAAQLPARPVATHRHKKRGTEYVLIGIGKMQAEHWYLPGAMESGPSVDMREVAVYHKVDDPTELWVRPREEFEDGRFESLSALEGEGHE